MDSLIPEFRSSIRKLEEFTSALPQVQIKTTHYHAEGLYAREIYIPAGVVLTGMIHKHEHINIISKGRIVVVTEDGKKEIQAPFTMISRPGTKRAGYTLEDTVWTTVHRADSTDLEELERELVTNDYFEITDESIEELEKL